MKPNDKLSVQKTIYCLQNGTATRAQLIELLISIREQLPNDMLKDIAHCVAHSNRDRGLAYTYIESFIDHLINTFRQGGVLVVNILFPLDEVIESMQQDLSALAFNIDKNSLLEHKESLRQSFFDILEDIEIKVKNPIIKSCKFEVADDKGVNKLAFTLHFKDDFNGVIHFKKTVGLAFPILE